MAVPVAGTTRSRMTPERTWAERSWRVRTRSCTVRSRCGYRKSTSAHRIRLGRDPSCRQRSMAELRSGGPRSRLNALERRCCRFEPELSLTWRATARAIALPEEMRSSSLESLIGDIPPFCDLAASTNVVDLAVDVRVFFIKTLLRYRCGRVNIGRARLAVAYRRRPGSGCSFESSL